MCGTANVVDVWLLLEYRPAWGGKALAESDLATATLDWIQSSVEKCAERGLQVRPQLIRQPELERDEVRLLIGYGGRLAQFSGRGYDFIQAVDLSALVDGDLPDGAEILEDPRYFICTNGQRDLCCSRFGRPVYTSLHERVGERAWQVSHLGGHRFAPNVLVLPQGIVYGRVHLESLEAFTDRVESGTISFPHIRGRSVYPRHVQAAEALSGLAGLRLLHVDGDEDAARVTFATADAPVTIAVKRSDVPLDVLGSCAAEAADQLYPYQVC
jgi:hypothetical protein